MHLPLIEAGPDDIEAVVALWHACGLTRPWNDPRRDFLMALEVPTSTVLLARESGQVVGSAMVGFDGHRGWVYYLAVAAPLRRRGCGRALMQAAEEWLRTRGAPKLQLMVRRDNADALAFHRSIGLEEQDVIVLGRHLENRA